MVNVFDHVFQRFFKILSLTFLHLRIIAMRHTSNSSRAVEYREDVRSHLAWRMSGGGGTSVLLLVLLQGTCLRDDSRAAAAARARERQHLRRSDGSDARGAAARFNHLPTGGRAGVLSAVQLPPLPLRARASYAAAPPRKLHR